MPRAATFARRMWNRGPVEVVSEGLSKPEPRRGGPLVTGLVVLLLALRAAATITTVAGGGVGGLFIPLVVEGALRRGDAVVTSDGRDLRRLGGPSLRLESV